MAFRKKKIPVNSQDDPQGTGDAEIQTANGQEGEEMERDADFSLLEDEEDSTEDEGGEDETSSPDELQSELDVTRQNYLRALADLENYKKRATRERSELIKYQGERVFSDILDIVDNLELAVEHAEADPEKLKEGVQLILKMFHDILSRWEVRSKPGLNEQFDPNMHAAISRLPSADHEPGTIINELKKAYFYKDRLLRPAEVVVAVAAEKHEAKGSEADSDQVEEASESEETEAEKHAE